MNSIYDILKENNSEINFSVGISTPEKGSSNKRTEALWAIALAKNVLFLL